MKIDGIGLVSGVPKGGVSLTPYSLFQKPSVVGTVAAATNGPAAMPCEMLAILVMMTGIAGSRAMRGAATEEGRAVVLCSEVRGAEEEKDLVDRHLGDRAEIR